MASVWLQILAVAVVLLTVLYVAAVVYFRGWRRPGEPPLLWSFLPYLGDMFALGMDPVGYMRKRLARTGSGVFTSVFQGYRTHFIADPTYLTTVHRAKEALSFQEIILSVTNAFDIRPDMVRRLDEVTVHRDIQQHLQAPSATTALTQRFLGELNRLFGEVTRGSTDWIETDLFDLARDIVVGGSAVTLMGDEYMRGGKQRLTEVVRDIAIYDKWQPLLALGLKMSWIRPAQRAWDNLRARVPLDTTPGRVSSLIARRNETHLAAGLSAQETRAAEAIILWAGNVNTVPAAFWSTYFVLRDPALRQRARAEVDAVMGACAARGTAFGFDELRQLRVLEAVMMETLRLFSYVVLLRQFVEKDGTTLQFPDGRRYTFRCGDRVCIVPPQMHHDPEIFPDPETFQWDRFYAPDGAPPKKFYKSGHEVPLTSIWMPFGGGRHICPGRFFAFNEIKLFTAYVLHNFDVEFMPGAPVDRWPKRDETRRGVSVLPPVEPVPVRFRPRTTGPAAVGASASPPSAP